MPVFLPLRTGNLLLARTWFAGVYALREEITRADTLDCPVELSWMPSQKTFPSDGGIRSILIP